MKNSVVTEGTVIDKAFKGTGVGPRYYGPEITFITENGDTVTFIQAHFTLPKIWKFYQLGDKMPVRYVPEAHYSKWNSRTNVQVEPPETTVYDYVSLFLGIGFLLFSSVFIGFSHILRKAQK